VMAGMMTEAQARHSRKELLKALMRLMVTDTQSGTRRQSP
jgi:hypothetical protein